MFLATSLPVGGAERLLVDLLRRLDRTRFAPQVCCLKTPGTLGEVLAGELPVSSGLLRRRIDVAVLWRLTRLLRERHVQAVVTVGAGDKMFWGRLAARCAGVPAVIAALHSIGWPDPIQWPNRLLTPITDAFVAVAEAHGRHLIDVERLPAPKVRVIANGVDLERFRPRPRAAARRRLGLPEDVPVAGIVAALRPEKNHEAFLRAAARVRGTLPAARFLVVGDGARRAALERLSSELGLGHAVRFAGERGDVPEILAALDVFVLSSHMEASPVSVLEAMAAARPVVAPGVGALPESVADGETGFLVPARDEHALAERLTRLLQDPLLARRLGAAGRRRVVERHGIERMVDGYERLLAELLARRPRPRGAVRR